MNCNTFRFICEKNTQSISPVSDYIKLYANSKIFFYSSKRMNENDKKAEK